MGTTVFISHSSADKQIVDKLCARLKQKNVSFWVSSRNIPPGRNWEIEIEDNLEGASHVLVIASSHSLASDYVRSEVQQALDKKKIVIPVLVEKVDLPVRWKILQWIDLTGGGPTASQAFDRLCDSLPKLPLVLFEEYLMQPDKEELLKQILKENPHWVYAGASSVYPETYRPESKDVPASQFDILPFCDEADFEFLPSYSWTFIAGYGPLVDVTGVFLASPYEIPTLRNGNLRHAFAMKMSSLYRWITRLSEHIRFRGEQTLRRYDVHVIIYSGQHHMYEPSVDHRHNLSQMIEDHIQNRFSKQISRCSVNIRSYTNLLEQARKAPSQIDLG